MFRIAVAFEFDTLNGGERSMLAVMDALRGGKLDFVVLAPNSGRLADEVRSRGIELIPLQLREERRVDDADERLLDAVRRAKADLIHANSLSMSVLLGSVADRIAVPCIGHLRDILKLSKNAISKLNQNDAIVAVSAATKSYHVEQGLDPNKTNVIYNGVDCEHFTPRPTNGYLKQELEIPDDAFLVATIGQIGMRKGLDTLAAAAALVAQRLKDIHFLLIGERYSEKDEAIEYEAGVHRRFEQPELKSRTHWLGYRDDVPQILNEIDVLAHPANQEPLGRVLLEAAASGVAIIATRVGGTEEILTDGNSARLIPAKDPVALADALVELYQDAALRESIATNAGSQILSKFAVATAAHNLREFWRRALSCGP